MIISRVSHASPSSEHTTPTTEFRRLELERTLPLPSGQAMWRRCRVATVVILRGRP